MFGGFFVYLRELKQKHMLNIIVQVEDLNTGTLIDLGYESKEDLINCINKYFELFKMLPPVGTWLSFHNDEPYVVSCIDFSSYEKCTFVYLTTLPLLYT